MSHNTLKYLIITSMITTSLFPFFALPAHGKDYSNHYGTDFRCTGYRYVWASDDSVVVSVTPLMRGENQIVLRTDDGGLCHYIYVQATVQVGQRVRAGDCIGFCDDKAPTVSGFYHYAYQPGPDAFFVKPQEHLPAKIFQEGW